MVHAYDHCRAKIDNQNCLHIACTEVIVSFSSSNLQIRASSLSGDCNYTQELMRGHWRDKIEKHHEVSGNLNLYLQVRNVLDEEPHFQ